VARQEKCIQSFGGGRHERKRPFGRPRCRWEDNIKIDLQEVRCEAWTGLIWLRQGQVTGAYDCGNEHLGSIKCGEFLDYRRTC